MFYCIYTVGSQHQLNKCRVALNECMLVLGDPCVHAAETQGLQLSEGSIWYGLHMLERSGGPMRQHIMTENVYEQRLLPEVVRHQPIQARCFTGH